mmetsp:Transcript_5594/g.16643  ORF Transcript_5594/g.16643 Transcript_5594/m.16643 type:complete len:144 (-) Transcript_5594:85-516(-)
MGRLAVAFTAAGLAGPDEASHAGEAPVPALLPALPLGVSRRVGRSAVASAFLLGKLDQPPPRNDDDRAGEATWSIPYSGEWTTMRDLHNQLGTNKLQFQRYGTFAAGVVLGGVLFLIPAWSVIKFNRSLEEHRAQVAAPIMLQ